MIDKLVIKRIAGSNHLFPVFCSLFLGLVIIGAMSAQTKVLAAPAAGSQISPPSQINKTTIPAGSKHQSNLIKSGSSIIVLKNGLRVILINQPSFPMVSCQLWYHKGSSADGSSAGACYALKHILNLEPMLKEKSTAVGLIKRAAQFDSFVSDDFTAFVINAVDSDLEGCLKIQAKRLNANLEDADTQIMLDGMAEFNRKANMRKELNGLGHLEEEVRALAASKNRPDEKALKLPRVPVIQRVQSVKKVKEFYSEEFKKAPVTLVIAGKFDSGRVLQSVQKQFASSRSLSAVKAQVQPPHPDVSENADAANGKSPGAGGEKSFTKFINGKRNEILVAFNTPGLASKNIAPLIVLESLFDNSVHGLLKNRFLENSLCKEARANLELRRGGGLFKVHFSCEPDVAPEVVLKDFNELLGTIGDISIDSISLTRAKKRARMRFLKASSGPYEAAYQHGFLDSLESHSLSEEWLRLIDSVKDSDIQRVAKAYICRENSTVGVYKTKQAKASIKTDGDYNVADMGTTTPSSDTAQGNNTNANSNSDFDPASMSPEVESNNPIHFSNMKQQETVLKNGIKLVVFTVPNSGLIGIKGALNCGFAQEPADKHGVSQLNTALMNGDSKKITRKKSLILQSNRGLSKEDLLSFRTEAKNVVLKCNATRESLKTLLKLISHHIRYPDISDAKLVSAKRRAIDTALFNYEASKDKLKDHLLRNLLQKDSPYGPVQINKLVTDIRGLGPDDLREFRKKTVNPAELTLAAAGDITMTEFKGLVQAVFGDWQPAGDAKKVVSPGLQPNSRTVLKVVLNNQSDGSVPEPQALLMGKLYEDRDGSILANLSLLNCALNGHPVHSLLPDKSISLKAQAAADHSLWTARIISGKNELVSSFDSLKSTLNRLVDQGLPQGRLKELKDYLIRSSVMEREKNIFTMVDTLLRRSLNSRTKETATKLVTGSEEEFNQFLKAKLKPDNACLVFDLSRNSRALARKLNMHK